MFHIRCCDNVFVVEVRTSAGAQRCAPICVIFWLRTRSETKLIAARDLLTDVVVVCSLDLLAGSACVKTKDGCRDLRKVQRKVRQCSTKMSEALMVN